MSCLSKEVWGTLKHKRENKGKKISLGGGYTVHWYAARFPYIMIAHHVVAIMSVQTMSCCRPDAVDTAARVERKET